MPGLNSSEIVVAAGSLVAQAPAGTAAPADAIVAPAVTWVDLGYVNEDGITWSESPDETNVPAWQSADPVKVIIASITRTFAFNLMQWNSDVLKFVIGGTATAGKFVPSKSGRPEVALLLRWTSGTTPAQLYVPRGKVTGDVSTQLVRSGAAVFSATFTATPSGAENAYEYSAAGIVLVQDADGNITEKASK